MSNEIEIGEYVRTNKGQIDRLQYEIDNNWRSKDNDGNIIARCEENKYWLENIVKHSKNLIYLIEEGDYVNGHLVIDIDKINDLIFYEDTDYEDGIHIISNYDIKSIVTKEQFKNMEYKVGV